MAHAFKARPASRPAAPCVRSGALLASAQARAQPSAMRGMNAFDRHQHYLRNYTLFYGNGAELREARRPKGPDDAEVLRTNHRFLWAEDADASADAPTADPRAMSWEQRLAKRYHDTLFKEYALADMSRYKEGAVGLRWRTEREGREPPHSDSVSPICHKPKSAPTLMSPVPAPLSVTRPVPAPVSLVSPVPAPVSLITFLRLAS